jgi:hypothetical protein
MMCVDYLGQLHDAYLSRVQAVGGSSFFIVFLALVLILQFRGDRRCREHIAAWADENHFTVSTIVRRMFFLGPFWWHTSRSQRVYDVWLTDARGTYRHAVVRVGGWFVGALDPQVEAKWLDGSPVDH